MKPFFIDTNIIMYCVGEEHPLKEPCQKILGQIRDGKISVVTNTEVLQEVLYRYLSLNWRTEALQITKSLADICEKVYPVELEDMEGAMDLLKDNTFQIRDAIHVATMLRHGITSIISTDKDFDRLRKIKRINPASASPTAIP